MITANKIKIVPTRFPDGTSQVWHLPKKLLNAYDVSVVWEFEEEREIWDLLSLRRLLYAHPMSLHMPYLPFARQDKAVSNDSTFNLEVLADLLNSMRLVEVTALDPHSYRAPYLIKNFRRLFPDALQSSAIKDWKADMVVFPDSGASVRYPIANFATDTITFNKIRSPKTGLVRVTAPRIPCEFRRFLIVDDICDGGATFIQVAEAIRKVKPRAQIALCVTHGIFSKGTKILKRAGIKKIYHRNGVI